MSEGNGNKHLQILKSREDQHWVSLIPPDDAADTGDSFVLMDGTECSWANGKDIITTKKLRKRIEPWLTALCQSEHLSLLLGSGLAHATHHMASQTSLPGMSEADFGDGEMAGVLSAAVQRSAEVPHRGPGNIEDQLRVGNELLRGLEILTNKGWTNDWAGDLRARLNNALKGFAASILAGERGIATAADDQRNGAFNYLVTFLMSFASRSGTRDRLHIFTSNYDRLIEAGADVAGLHLLDRFVGALTPVFRSSRLGLDIHYNPPGIRGEPRYLEGVARFTKLHGSVDWVDASGVIRRVGLPFGAKEVSPYLEAPGLSGVDAMRLLIYPNAAKDRETAGYPYVDLFRDFAAACCRPNHTLFSYGYGFGDEHINRVIEDMLTIPSTHLVIISYDDPLGRIMETCERIGRPAQVSLMIGDHLGDLTRLVDWYLPKPAIDRTTYRMAELLKARFGAVERDPQAPTEEQDPALGSDD